MPVGNSFPPYSVLMSVYALDKPEWVREAFNSVVMQSLPPYEVVVIIDGTISKELQSAIDDCRERYPQIVRVISLPQNKGLAEAMRIGVGKCHCEWIARMDADDISDPYRCEKELREAMQKKADIVGCDCNEFIDQISNAVAKRLFPADHDALVDFSKRRTPFCHPAVMMKKTAVERAGNYQDIHLLEDYDLFVRMLASGAKGCTVKEILYHVRVGESFYARRGGIKYVATLLRYNLHLLKTGWMSLGDFFMRSCGNILVGLAPSSLRTWLYRRVLRS